MITLNDCKQPRDHDYKGVSEDIKPTENVAVNALFWELDTNLFYFFNGEEWKLCGYNAS